MERWEIKWAVDQFLQGLRIRSRPHLTRRQLLKAPMKPWQEHRTYRTLYLVPSGRLHGSGYMCIALVGEILTEDKPRYEIAGWCDDVEWHVPDTWDTCNKYHVPNLRTDCLFPSGIMHIWRTGYQFRVGDSLSSVDVYVEKASKQEEDGDE